MMSEEHDLDYLKKLVKTPMVMMHKAPDPEETRIADTPPVKDIAHQLQLVNQLDPAETLEPDTDIEENEDDE